MEDLETAYRELDKGNFILLHDSSAREDETDMVILAEHVRAGHVDRMRVDAGGLICVAFGKDLAARIGLPFMSSVLLASEKKYPLLSRMRANDIRYDTKSAFSLTVNHRKTFTGISDIDRALTISELGRFCSGIEKEKDFQKSFGEKFRAPGHVSLLISSGLENREGHTELACAVAEMGGLTQCVVVCEMMDSRTHRSLTLEDALLRAKEDGLTLLEGRQVIEGYRKWRG